MRKCIANYIFNYWLILLLWQNLFTNSVRGTADTLVKLTLLLYLCYGFFRNSKGRARKNITIVLFIGTMLLSLFMNDLSSLSLGIFLYYAFPCIYAFLTYSMGDLIKLEADEVRAVNRKIIVVVSVAVLYTVIFEHAQFITALSASNGYGNELHGFFTSMYEFALYLFYGIAGCIREIEDGKKNGKNGKWIYYVLIVVFFFTMILTFSRTAIIGCIAFLAIYSLFNLRSTVAKMVLLFGMILIVLCMTIPQLNTYVFQTVWKSGISNSRERLYAAAIDYYNAGSTLDKIFGHGVSESRYFFMTFDGYGSIHNGYLQILVYYGWMGIGWVVTLAVSQIKIILRCMHYDKTLAVESFGFLIVGLLTMMPSTVILFNSSIDAFFLTSFMIVIPRLRMKQTINNYG